MKTTPFRFALVAVFLTNIGSALADDDEKFVSCGSAIKLTHVESGGNYILRSDERQLQSGSGQQLVTAEQNKRSSKGLWQVREGSNTQFCEAGTPVKCGQILRLMHLETGSNLHTHGIRSPISSQHEVTGFGQQGEGDAGDDWKVICDAGGSYFSGGDDYWTRDKIVQFKSVATNRLLGASSTSKFTEQNCGRGCPILNQLEVFGRDKNDSYSHWKTEMGVYLSK